MFDDDLAWVLVMFLGAEKVLVDKGRLAVGPYSNGYQKTFVGNVVWRIRLGEVVRQVCTPCRDSRLKCACVGTSL